MDTISFIILIGAMLIGLVIIGYLVYTRQWDRLRGMAYQLMLRAEKILSEGVGAEKFALVFTELYNRIPPWFRLFVTREDLEVLLQRWYDAAKDWLDDGQINGSTPVSAPRR